MMSRFTKILGVIKDYKVNSFLGFDLKRGKIIAQLYGITACLVVICSFSATIILVVTPDISFLTSLGIIPDFGEKYESFLWMLDTFKTMTWRKSDCK